MKVTFKDISIFKVLNLIVKINSPLLQDYNMQKFIEAQNSSTIQDTLRTQDSLANEDEDQGTSPNKSTEMTTEVMVQDEHLTDKPENTMTKSKLSWHPGMILPHIVGK